MGRLKSLLLILVLLLTSGCLRQAYPTTAPVTSDVELQGAKVVSASAVLSKLSTAKSPRFLGIWDGVLFDYELFDEAVLARDLERIERFYHARGYYEAKVTAARVIRVDEHRVRVELRVFEGAPVVTRGDIQRFGLEGVSFDVGIAAYTAVTLRAGEPLDEDEYEASKQAMVSALADAGYAFAKVTGRVEVDIARHEAKVAFFAQPGPLARYGKVDIVGLREVPENKVRQALQISEGEAYSESSLQDARRALIALGVFNGVKINADRSSPDTRQVPISVVVEEAPLRSLKLGGGVRLDAQQTSAHLVGSWEHKNFLGGLRHLSLEARPGVVLFPTRTNNIEAPNRLLFEGHLRSQLKQPAFLEGRTTGSLATGIAVFPLLYSESTRDDPLIGFVRPDASLGLERAFLNHHLYLTPSYNWQAYLPFDYDALSLGKSIDVERESRLIDVIASFPELSIRLDLRDNSVQPKDGALIGVSWQLANGLFSGTVDDMRVRPELRGFYELAPGWVLAGRATVGFLFPSNYATSTESSNREQQLLDECEIETANPGADPDPALNACQLLAEDEQKLLVRGFFSGGPESNRGYPYRGVGPHRALSFLSRGNVDCTADQFRDSRACLRPIGGLTLWEASIELRFPTPISESLRAAIFVDASDVTRGVAEFRSNALHLSTGFGVRYLTPIGPVRFDLGFRIPGSQAPGIDSGNSQADGDPPMLFGVIPATINLALGEAY
ncbi:MAG TPA: POTRA domain-containing protein [Polyangiaceae bacterium]|nr:POTRA domain-containing protein [Polyangiaceae bacterium]